jgi:uncharacterized membrane protein
MKKFISIGAVLGVMPLFASAQIGAQSIISTITGILNTLIPVLITVAVVYFIWGVIQYTVSTDEEAKKKAKTGIIQGLIGLFVIVSFWGIIAIVKSTFNFQDQQLNQIPTVPTNW